MKRLILPFGIMCLAMADLRAQGYQPQYPYDPYNASQQPSSSGYSSSGGGGGGYAGNQAPPSGTPMLSYGYLEANYSFSSFSNVTGLNGGSGIQADLSVPLFNPLYLHFAVDWLSGSVPDSSLSFNLTSISAGAGVHFGFTDRFQIFGEVGLQYDAVSSPIPLSTSELAVYMRPGLRLALTDRWELQGYINFNTTNNLDDRVYTVATYFSIISALDLGFGVDFSNDVTTYRGGLRVRW